MNNLDWELTMITQEYLNSQDLLDQFWSDCYKAPEKIQTSHAIENLLRNFRKSLDSSSTTAEAIDNGFPLEEISRYMEKEGFTEIAQALNI